MEVTHSIGVLRKREYTFAVQKLVQTVMGTP